MTLKVLIAEDEPRIGLFLKRVIEEVVNVKIVDIVDNGKEAIKQAEIHKPHVMFLDINMPEMSGLDVAQELIEIQPGIYFVFVTAYSNFALEAFKYYSFDYILKPFDERRIKKTIRRLRNKIFEEKFYKSKQNQHILIEINDRKIFVNPEEILYIESYKPKVLIKTETAQYVIKGNLQTLEQKLNPHNFFRCHKSYLVNLKKIKEVISIGRTNEIVLQSGDKVFLSREREKVLRERFEIK